MKDGGLSVTRRNFLKDLMATGVVVGSTRQAYPHFGTPIGAVPVKPGSTDWPRFGYDLHNTRFNSKESQLGRENVGQLKLKWKFETDAPIQTTPTVIGNTLYFGTLSGYQYALDSATGTEKWNRFMGYNSDPGSPLQGVRSSSQHHNGRIYFGTGMAKVHCLDAESGEEIWQRQLDDDPMRNRAQVFCSVAVYQDKLYVGTSSGQAKMACLDADTGAVRWQFYVVPDKTRGGGGSIWNSPAIDESANIVYFGTGSVRGFMPADPMLFTESMIAFDADTGEMLWYDQLRGADPFDLDYSCHPMIFDAVHPSRSHETRPCVGGGAKSGFFCFNRYTGEKLWKTMVTHAGAEGGPELNSTATAYNRIFMVSNATGIRGRAARSATAALHAYTGDVMWWVVNSATIMGPVAVANHVFYQGLTDGTLEAIDAATGEQLWQHQLPDMIRGGMAIANGNLYTSTGESVIWRVQKATPGKKYGLYAFGPDGS
jgi:outer membrane protein assembly factor BamB